MNQFTRFIKQAVRLSSIIGASSMMMVGLISAKPSAAAALNTWHYAMDSFNDSISGNDVGGTKYEIFGLAMMQTNDSVYFAINSNLPIWGTNSSYANDAWVDWGDLILNFTGQNLNAANGNLIAIDFIRNFAVYDNVTVKSVATENGLRLNSLSEYNGWVSRNGGNPSIGDLSAFDPYFDLSQNVPNVITSGNRIGDVNIVDGSTLASLGLNFTPLGGTGSQTFGFSVDSSLFSIGNFIAHLAPECDNDIVSMIATITESQQEPEPVPEPSLGLGLLLTAGLGGLVKKQKQKQK
jgi:hypothetical protein